MIKEKHIWIWIEGNSNMYSTKSTYGVLQALESKSLHKDIFAQIWKLNIPPKVTLFLWKVIWNRFPTGDNTRKRNIDIQNWDYLCPFCKCWDESLYHLLFCCRVLGEIWNFILSILDVVAVLPFFCRGPFQEVPLSLWRSSDSFAGEAFVVCNYLGSMVLEEPMHIPFEML